MISWKETVCDIQGIAEKWGQEEPEYMLYGLVYIAVPIGVMPCQPRMLWSLGNSIAYTMCKNHVHERASEDLVNPAMSGSRSVVSIDEDVEVRPQPPDPSTHACGRALQE